MFGWLKPQRKIQAVVAPPAAPVAPVLSLGASLLKIEKKREADRRKADEDYWAAQRAQVAKDGEVVRKFIKAVSVSFTHDIKNGREPAPVFIPINILELLNYTKWRGMYSYTGLPEFHLNHEKVVQELFNWGRVHGLHIRLDANYISSGDGEYRRWSFSAMSGISRFN